MLSPPKATRALAAGSALPIDKKFMAAGFKTPWQLGFYVDAATLEFEDLAAHIAAEVVVVFLPCYLVPLSFARQFDRHKPVLIGQRKNIPVHRRYAQATDLGLRQAKNLLRRQGPVRLEKG